MKTLLYIWSAVVLLLALPASALNEVSFDYGEMLIRVSFSVLLILYSREME